MFAHGALLRVRPRGAWFVSWLPYQVGYGLRVPRVRHAAHDTRPTAWRHHDRPTSQPLYALSAHAHGCTPRRGPHRTRGEVGVAQAPRDTPRNAYTYIYNISGVGHRAQHPTMARLRSHTHLKQKDAPRDTLSIYLLEQFSSLMWASRHAH